MMHDHVQQMNDKHTSQSVIGNVATQTGYFAVSGATINGSDHIDLYPQSRLTDFGASIAACLLPVFVILCFKFNSLWVNRRKYLSLNSYMRFFFSNVPPDTRN